MSHLLPLILSVLPAILVAAAVAIATLLDLGVALDLWPGAASPNPDGLSSSANF